MNLDSPWPLRVIWLLLPVVLGPILDAAFRSHSTPVVWLLATFLWLAWTIGLVATFVPRTLGLTFIRTVTPVGLVLVIWAAATAETVSTMTAVLAALGASVATVAVMAPTTGDLFVNGSAYGPERRFALRTPTPLLFGPLFLVWALAVFGLITGPLLLAAKAWWLGAALVGIGFPVAYFASRSLHQLSRRWLVFVPAGIVIHDPTALSAQLFQRSAIRSLGPAPANTSGEDLTGGAAGLALELVLHGVTKLEPVRRFGEPPTPVETDTMIFTPTRPGIVLAEAKARRFPVTVDP